MMSLKGTSFHNDKAFSFFYYSENLINRIDRDFQDVNLTKNYFKRFKVFTNNFRVLKISPSWI